MYDMITERCGSKSDWDEVTGPRVGVVAEGSMALMSHHISSPLRHQEATL